MADLYQPRNAEELKQRALRDARLAAIDAGADEPAVNPGSDLDILATMVANTALIGFANIAAIEADFNVFSATGQALDELRAAEGLPEVVPTGAKGALKIRVLGPTTIPNGLQFRYPNGLRGRVVGGYTNPADNSEVNVEAIDTGTQTNLAPGTKVTFVGPPTNLLAEAEVSSTTPLTGGIDEESDERKRARIINVRRNKPAGGNWAHLRQIATDALGSVQDAYVYPALGGPSSVKIVVVKAFNRETKDFSRTLPDAALTIVRGAVHRQVAGDTDHIVQSAADEAADFAIQIQIPDSILAGGNGLGWVDQSPWPGLEAADNGRITITATDDDFDQITVSANTSTSPTAGLTHVAWWSSVDQRFYHALVVGVSGSAGAWVLDLDRPFVDSFGNGPETGEYVCPDAQNLDGYGTLWLDIFESLGPGENTTSANRLPRAKRHPYATDEDPSSITRATLARLVRAYPEITDISLAYAPTTTPTVPPNVRTAPNILVPRHLGFYPL